MIKPNRPSVVVSSTDIPQRAVTACFVVVYLGDLPEWIEYFFSSCEINNKFHWLIFVTNDSDIAPPGNVTVHRIERERLERLVSSKIGIRFNLSYGYKLCDLKPAYGDIFSEYLLDFDYWGYCDIDVVWGDLERFINLVESGRYDVITASSRLLVGHCTLLRNTPELVRLYRDCIGYVDKFSSGKCEAFDETDFSKLVLQRAQERQIALLNPDIQIDDCVIWWAGRKRYVIVWSHGQLIDLFALQRLAYFHFIKSKYRNGFSIDTMPEGCRRFYVDERGLHALARLSDLGHFLARLLLTLVTTLPWYGKELAKFALPRSALVSLRRMLQRNG